MALPPVFASHVIATSAGKATPVVVFHVLNVSIRAVKWRELRKMKESILFNKSCAVQLPIHEGRNDNENDAVHEEWSRFARLCEVQWRVHFDFSFASLSFDDQKVDGWQHYLVETIINSHPSASQFSPSVEIQALLLLICEYEYYNPSARREYYY